ncbi:hypothetical protein A2U01_0100366, partial [Trifolium medium]|nr:hypothetical protein [Trifolium medium]
MENGVCSISRCGFLGSSSPNI